MADAKLSPCRRHAKTQTTSSKPTPAHIRLPSAATPNLPALSLEVSSPLLVDASIRAFSASRPADAAQIEPVFGISLQLAPASEIPSEPQTFRPDAPRQPCGSSRANDVLTLRPQPRLDGGSAVRASPLYLHFALPVRYCVQSSPRHLQWRRRTCGGELQESDRVPYSICYTPVSRRTNPETFNSLGSIFVKRTEIAAMICPQVVFLVKTRLDCQSSKGCALSRRCAI